MSFVYNTIPVAPYEIKDEELDFDGLIWTNSNPYTPVATLFNINKDNIEAFRSTYQEPRMYELLRALAKKRKLGYFSTKPSDSRYTSTYDPRTTLKNETKFFIEALRKYLILPEIYNLSAKHVGTSKSLMYSTLASMFFSSTIANAGSKTFSRLLVGNGIMYVVPSNRLLFIVMCKTELMKYQRLHYITTGDFDYSAMEFWIDSSVDTPRFESQGLRKAYKDYIRPELLKYRMETVIKENLSDRVGSSFNIPQTSIAEIEGWKSSVLKSFLEKEQQDLVFNFKL